MGEQWNDFKHGFLFVELDEDGPYIEILKDDLEEHSKPGPPDDAAM